MTDKCKKVGSPLPKQAQNRLSFVGKYSPFVGLSSPLNAPSVGTDLPFFRIRPAFSGFTLIELIVVLAVMAILGGIAAPNIRQMVQNSRLTGQTNELLGDLSFARNEAIKRGFNVVICRSSNPTAATPTCDTATPANWETGRLIFVDVAVLPTLPNNTYSVADGDILLRVRTGLEGGNTLRANRTNLDNYIAYTSSGITTLASPPAAPALPHHFKLCDGRPAAQARALAMDVTGHARVYRNGASYGTTPFTLVCP